MCCVGVYRAFWKLLLYFIIPVHRAHCVHALSLIDFMSVFFIHAKCFVMTLHINSCCQCSTGIDVCMFFFT